MRRLFAVCAAAVFCTVALAAQDPATMKPGPEQKNLARFAGTWKMEGTMEASPLGPGGKMTATETCTMFEGGWHLVCDSNGTGPMGAMKGHGVLTYDRSTKQYRYFSVNNFPDAEMATGTLKGNTWTWNGKMDMGGKTIHQRFVIVEKSPTTHTFTWSMSPDGKAWKTAMTGTSTKAGS